MIQRTCTRMKMTRQWLNNWMICSARWSSVIVSKRLRLLNTSIRRKVKSTWFSRRSVKKKKRSRHWASVRGIAAVTRIRVNAVIQVAGVIPRRALIAARGSRVDGSRSWTRREARSNMSIRLKAPKTTLVVNQTDFTNASKTARSMPTTKTSQRTDCNLWTSR